jgi:peptide/nickel transport system substrate-binding protein
VLKKWLAGFLATVLILAGCSSKSGAPGAEAPKEPASPSGPQAGGTLVIGIGADPTILDPMSVLNNEASYIESILFDRIVAYKPGTTEPTGGLAESWTVSADGKTILFKLRKGVTFSDGTPFNADTWIKELDRAMNPKNPNYYKNVPGISSHVPTTFKNLDKYEKVDDTTVKFTLKAPDATVIPTLGRAATGVQSPAAVEKWGKDIIQHPVGTGPFMLEEWVQNDHITLKANPNYWGGKPLLDKIIFRVIPENSVRLLKLKSGEIQIMDGINPADVAGVRTDLKLQVFQQPGLTTNGVRLPFNVKPFDNKLVRQALNYAVNKDEMNKTLYQGVAESMVSPMPKVEWGVADLKPYAYDPEKAKKLLAEAGYPNGFKVQLLSYDVPRGYNPAGGKMAVVIQDYLAKVGVQVEIKTLEWGTFLQTVRSGKWDGMSLGGYTGDNGDPDNFLYNLFSSETIPVGNSSAYKNAEVDKLTGLARIEPTTAKRIEYYKTVQELIWDDAPWIWVNSVNQVRAGSAKVHNYELNPLQVFFGMEKVWLSK